MSAPREPHDLTTAHARVRSLVALVNRERAAVPFPDPVLAAEGALVCSVATTPWAPIPATTLDEAERDVLATMLGARAPRGAA